MTTTTPTATQWLAGIRTALVPESYRELASALEDITKEHGVDRLGLAHIEMALRRLGANGNHKIMHGGTQQ